MEWGDWKMLHRALSEPEDLGISDKDLINWVTGLIYNENGSPKAL